jgi:hypothetical protein
MTREEKIKRFFACRSKADKAYMTGDGEIFLKKKDADSNAKSLKNKSVETILKDQNNGTPECNDNS